MDKSHSGRGIIDIILDIKTKIGVFIMTYSKNEYINVAFNIDTKYTTHVEALIKSICYYNRHVNFYVLHTDVAQEWFDGIQQKLDKLACRIFSVHISEDVFEGNKTLAHISSSSSYFRLMIPRLIKQKRVLYLDADIIVNDSLESFFNSDLNGAPLGVVKDYGLGEHFPFSYLDASISRNYFNSGVLLIDCEKWRQENLVEILLDKAKAHSEEVLYGDQCILNMVLRERAKYYGLKENFQINYNENLKFSNSTDNVSVEFVPTIIHYAAKHKPWDTQNLNLFYREKYWFFRHMDWAYLIMRPSV